MGKKAPSATPLDTPAKSGSAEEDGRDVEADARAKVQAELSRFVENQGLERVEDLNEFEPDELSAALDADKASLGLRRLLRNAGCLPQAGAKDKTYNKEKPGVAALRSRLAALAVNPAAKLAECLATMGEPVDWPWEGTQYGEHVAPEYLTAVYCGGGRAIDYARNFIKQHSLEKCKPATDSMFTAAHMLDMMMLHDGINPLSSATAEIAVRKMYSIERVYENCSEPHDWKTKANWKWADVYDITRATWQGARVAKADQAARKVLEHEAQNAKWLSKAPKADL